MSIEPQESAPSLLSTVSDPAGMPLARANRPGWFSRTYPSIVVSLLLIQYVFVNLILTSYTTSIVILKDISAPFLSILILFTWILGDLSRHGRWRLPRHGMIPATVAALLYWLTSVFTTPATAAGVYTWGAMLGYFIQVWALIHFLDSPARHRLALHTVMITNVLIIGYGFSQLAGLDVLVALRLFPDWGQSVFISTYGNRNFFAGYILTTLPILIGYLFYTKRPFHWLMISFLVGSNIYSLSVLHSFNAGTALLIALPVGLAFLVFNLRFFPMEAPAFSRGRQLARGALLAMSIISAMYVGRCMNCGLFPREVIYEWTHHEVSGEPSARLVFYQMAADGALRSPVFGRGLGSFNSLMPERRPSDYQRRGASHNTEHAHNELLEWLFETGIVGLSLFLLIPLAFLIEGWRDLRRHRGKRLFPLMLFSFIGPWVFWLHSLWGVESRWTGNSVTLWFTIGLVLALGRRRESSPSSVSAHGSLDPADAKPTHAHSERTRKLPPCFAALAAGMALIVLCYMAMSYRYWMADHHLRMNMMHTEGAGGNIPQAIIEAELARKLSYTIPSTYYKLAYSYLVAGRLDDALSAYRDCQSFAPNYAQLHINLAYLNDQMGYKIASAWERDRAAAIEKNTRNLRDAADYWLAMGDTTRAIAHLKHCFTFDYEKDNTMPIYCDGIVFRRILWHDRDAVHTDLGRIHAGMGRRELAIDELNRAIHLNSQNDSALALLAEMRRPTSNDSEVSLTHDVSEGAFTR